MSIIIGVGMPEWLVAYTLGSMQEWLITIGSTQEHAGVLIIYWVACRSDSLVIN